jgi:hypothetical protein
LYETKLLHALDCTVGTSKTNKPEGTVSSEKVTGGKGDAHHHYNQHPGLNKVLKQGNYLCYMK